VHLYCNVSYFMHANMNKIRGMHFDFFVHTIVQAVFSIWGGKQHKIGLEISILKLLLYIPIYIYTYYKSSLFN